MGPLMGYSFHEDLMTEILVRLPVKPLLRFQAVSKTWLSVISSPTFIRSHLRRAITNQQSDETLVMSDGVSVSVISLGSCLNIGATPEVSQSTGDFDFSIIPELYIVGSCNGIVCASVSYSRSNRGSVYNERLCLWNPATKQYKHIPPHNIRSHDCLGFGFDPIGDDFKVIRVISKPREDVCVDAEVYSVNRNSWTRVESHLTDYPVRFNFDVCVRGVLCCSGSHGLITFDLDKEVFNCGIKFPPGSSSAWVTEYKDLIAVIDYKFVHESNWTIKLWTFDDSCLRGGMEESWTLIFSFDVAVAPVDLPHFCLNSGDILLRVYDNYCTGSDDDCDDDYDDVYYLCNPDNKESKLVHFPDFGGGISRHIESLVSIRGSKQVVCDANADDNFGRQQLFWYSGYDE